MAVRPESLSPPSRLTSSAKREAGRGRRKASSPGGTRSSRASSAAPPAEESPLRTLVRSYGLLQRFLTPHFSSFGITGAQWGVLRVLDRAEKSGEMKLRITELSARLLVQPASVTGVVDKLERTGLLSRSSPADDRRVRELSLTPKGRQLIADVLRQHPDVIESLLSPFRDAERKQLQRLLTKLNRQIEDLL